METFFKSLGKKCIGESSLSVSFDSSDWLVSLLQKTSEDDNLLKAIKPFKINGNIEEIDIVFWERLGKPMMERNFLFYNANGYLAILKKTEEKRKWRAT